MAKSLYQKYRPTGFSEVSGQDHITRTLRNELNNESVAHAYLFSGPRGVGKTSTARLLARAINCENRTDGEPCGTCAHCTQIMNGQAMDIIEIDAASHTGVDNVRENIIEHARVANSQLPWKVFIIDEVHMLSTSAFNALLKTLEEPPKNTMFILATTELHKVPETIASRCERFTFHRISYDAIIERLQKLVSAENAAVSEDVLALVARRSEGCLRDAESLLGQVLTLGNDVTMDMVSLIIPRTDTGEVLVLWEHIVAGSTKEALNCIARLVDEGVQMDEFMRTAIDFLRSAMIWMVRQDDTSLQNIDIDTAGRERVQALSAKISVQRIAQMIDVLLAATDKMSIAAIPQLPLELAVVELIQEQGSEVVAPKQQSQQASNPQPTTVEAITEPQTEHIEKKNPEVAEGEKVESTPVEKVQEPTPDTEAIHTEQPQQTESTEEEPEARPINTGAALSVDDIRAQWSTLLKEMQNQNHALFLTFQVGQLIDVDEEKLRMGFEYQFYSDRLSDARNKPFMDAAFTAVYGRPFRVEVEIGKEFVNNDAPEQNIEQPSEDEVANVWDLAQAAFGNEEAAS